MMNYPRSSRRCNRLWSSLLGPGRGNDSSVLNGFLGHSAITVIIVLNLEYVLARASMLTGANISKLDLTSKCG